MTKPMPTKNPARTIPVSDLAKVSGGLLSDRRETMKEPGKLEYPNI